MKGAGPVQRETSLETVLAGIQRLARGGGGRSLVLALVAILALAAMAPIASASHFRFGNPSVENEPGDDSFLEKRIFLSEAWRRNSLGGCLDTSTPVPIGQRPASTACTGPDFDGNPPTHPDFSGTSLPGPGDVVRSHSNFNFGDGSSNVGPLLLVQAIDPGANWLQGAAIDSTQFPDIEEGIPHTYPGVGDFTAAASSCCRIGRTAENFHANNPDASFRYETTVNAGEENRPPRSTVPPIVNCLINTVCKFTIPAFDADGDPFQFRMSTNGESSLTQPSGASIDPNTGEYTFDGTDPNIQTLVNQGLAQSTDPDILFSTQVTIEDLDGTGAVKSKSAVDFFVRVVNATGAPPVFDTPPTPTCGFTVRRTTGAPITFDVQASDSDSTTVSLNAVGLPIGSTMTPELPTTGNPVTSTFSWPAPRAGTFIMFFTASDELAQQATCVITLIVTPSITGGVDGHLHEGVPMKALVRGRASVGMGALWLVIEEKNGTENGTVWFLDRQVKTGQQNQILPEWDARPNVPLSLPGLPALPGATPVAGAVQPVTLDTPVQTWCGVVLGVTTATGVWVPAMWNGQLAWAAPNGSLMNGTPVMQLLRPTNLNGTAQLEPCPGPTTYTVLEHLPEGKVNAIGGMLRTDGVTEQETLGMPDLQRPDLTLIDCEVKWYSQAGRIIQNGTAQLLLTLGNIGGNLVLPGDVDVLVRFLNETGVVYAQTTVTVPGALFETRNWTVEVPFETLDEANVTVEVIIDPDQAVWERDETNNNVTKEFLLAPPLKTDLAVVDIGSKGPDGNITQGHNAFNVTVQNVGQTGTNATTVSLDVDGTTLTQPIPALAPGEQWVAVFEKTLNGSATWLNASHGLADDMPANDQLSKLVTVQPFQLLGNLPLGLFPNPTTVKPGGLQALQVLFFANGEAWINVTINVIDLDVQVPMTKMAVQSGPNLLANHLTNPLGITGHHPVEVILENPFDPTNTLTMTGTSFWVSPIAANAPPLVAKNGTFNISQVGPRPLGMIGDNQTIQLKVNTTPGSNHTVNVTWPANVTLLGVDRSGALTETITDVTVNMTERTVSIENNNTGWMWNITLWFQSLGPGSHHLNATMFLTNTTGQQNWTLAFFDARAPVNLELPGGVTATQTAAPDGNVDIELVSLSLTGVQSITVVQGSAFDVQVFPCPAHAGPLMALVQPNGVIAPSLDPFQAGRTGFNDLLLSHGEEVLSGVLAPPGYTPDLMCNGKGYITTTGGIVNLPPPFDPANPGMHLTTIVHDPTSDAGWGAIDVERVRTGVMGETHWFAIETADAVRHDTVFKIHLDDTVIEAFWATMDPAVTHFWTQGNLTIIGIDKSLVWGIEDVTLTVKAPRLMLPGSSGFLAGPGSSADADTIALYKLDSLPTITDDSGNGRDGTRIGGTDIMTPWTTGLALDGVDDAIGIDAARQGLQGATAWTIEYLARSTDGAQAPAMINHQCENGWVIMPNASGIRFGIKTSTAAGCAWTAQAVATGHVWDDKWHHYALVWDGTTLFLYQDGVLLNSAAAAGTFQAATLSLQQALIGFDAVQDVYQAGEIDEVRISAVARKGEAIAADVDLLLHGFMPCDRVALGSAIINVTDVQLLRERNGNLTIRVAVKNDGNIGVNGTLDLTIGHRHITEPLMLGPGKSTLLWYAGGDQLTELFYLVMFMSHDYWIHVDVLRERFNVTTGGGGGGGGGGGTGTSGSLSGTATTGTPNTPGATSSFSFSTFPASTTNNLNVNFPFGSPVSNVNVDIGEAEGQVTTTLETFGSGPPPGVPPGPDGTTNGLYFDLSVTGAPVTGGFFDMSVPQSQLEGFDPSQVFVLHWDGSQWQTLPIEPVDTSSDPATFRVRTSSFSPFLLAVDVKGPDLVDEVPPDGPDVEPNDGATISDATPTISANWSDNRGVDPDRVTVVVDGVTVEANVTEDGFTYTPSEPLEEGEHTVELTVVDQSGLRTEEEWTFTFSPQPLDDGTGDDTDTDEDTTTGDQDADQDPTGDGEDGPADDGADGGGGGGPGAALWIVLAILVIAGVGAYYVYGMREEDE